MKRTMVALLAGVLILANGTEVSAAGLKDVFDAKYYAEQYADLKEAFGTNEKALYEHYMNYGMKEGRQMNPIIDVVQYRNKYSDLNAAFGDNWDAYVNHYFKYGVLENRDNGTDFDLQKYQEVYKDVKDAFGNDFKAIAGHYEEHGRKEGRKEGGKSRHKHEVKPPVAEAPDQDDDFIESLERTETTTKSDGSWYVSEYNALGQLAKRTFYFADGTMDYYFISEYNEEGLETGMKIYNPEGEMTSYGVNEYDANGELIKITTYSEDGSIAVNEYDRVNHTHTTIFYDAEGNVINKGMHQLDAEGNYIGYTEYNPDGSTAQVYVSATDVDGNITNIPIEGDIDWSKIKASMQEDGSVYVYRYADNGLEIECTYYDANLEFVHRTTNAYNEAGECVESIVYEADGGYCVNAYDRVNRTHTWTAFTADGTMYDKGVYDIDENGNYIRYTEYNMDGTVKQVYNYTTDENGNGILTPVE